jgi:hypothetical protein
MSPEERARLIERYRDGHAEVTRALEGITEFELDTPEAAGEWSPRQVVHHLADSEMASALRIRQLVAQEHAVIQGYDQEEYARVLYYDRPIEPSLAAFGAARACTVDLLVRMSEADWASAGTHSESGHFSAEGWLEYYANHAHDHADQIRRARAEAARRPGG